MSDFNKIIDDIQKWRKANGPNWNEVTYLLQKAQSMEQALIERTGVPPVGSHARLTCRVWPEREQYAYLSKGSTGKVTALRWTNNEEEGFWRVEYVPDCEWRYNEQGGYLYLHEAPGAIHSIPANCVELITEDEALPYQCYCSKCNWKGKSTETATGSGNYALCPGCQNRGHRKEVTLRFTPDTLIPGSEEKQP